MNTEAAEHSQDGPQEGEVTLDEALAIAIERHQQGKIVEAETIYERILEVKPECAEALHFLGLIKFQTGEAKTAMEHLERAISISPDYAAAHNNLGNLLSEQKQFEQAEVRYRTVVELEPEFADAHSNLGMVLKELHRLEEAESALRRAVELQPDHLQALNNLGTLLKERKKLDEAAQVLEKALAVKPDYPEAIHNIGLVYEAKGMYREAEEALRKAVTKGVDAYINLGRVLREQGRAEEAIEVYRKAIAMDDDRGEAYYNLGMLLEAMGQHDEAVATYAEWCKHEPDNQVARHMLAACSGSKVPARANDDYVRSIFDGFAPTFESRLKDLGYRAPELLVQVLGEQVEADGSKSVLDAGCGTGLCAPLLQPFATRMVGVDLSEGMLDLARERNIYDQLLAKELTEYLRTTDERFDVVLSADTLVYFGAVEDVLAGAWRVTEPGGIFLFSIEELDEEGEDFRLMPHGRYAHKASYVRRLLEQNGFDPVDMRPDVLRLEVGEPVHGLLVSARKPV